MRYRGQYKAIPLFHNYYFLFWIMGKKWVLKIPGLLRQIVKSQACLQATAAFRLLYLRARRWSAQAVMLPGNNGSFARGELIRCKSYSVRAWGTRPLKERTIPSLASSKSQVMYFCYAALYQQITAPACKNIVLLKQSTVLRTQFLPQKTKKGHKPRHPIVVNGVV